MSDRSSTSDHESEAKHQGGGEDNNEQPEKEIAGVLIKLPEWARWIIFFSTVASLICTLLFAEYQNRQWVAYDEECYVNGTQKNPPPRGVNPDDWGSCFSYFKGAMWQTCLVFLGCAIWSIAYFTDLIVTKVRGRSSGAFEIYKPKNLTSHPRSAKWYQWILPTLLTFGFWQIYFQAISTTRPVDVYTFQLLVAVIGPMYWIFQYKRQFLVRQAYGCFIITISLFVLLCWAFLQPDDDLIFYLYYFQAPIGIALAVTSLFIICSKFVLIEGILRRSECTMIEGPAWIGVYGFIFSCIILPCMQFIGSPTSEVLFAHSMNSTVSLCTTMIVLFSSLTVVGFMVTTLWFDSLHVSVAVTALSACLLYFIRALLGWGVLSVYPIACFSTSILGVLIFLVGFGCCLPRVDAHCNKKMHLFSFQIEDDHKNAEANRNPPHSDKTQDSQISEKTQ